MGSNFLRRLGQTKPFVLLANFEQLYFMILHRPIGGVRMNRWKVPLGKRMPLDMLFQVQKWVILRISVVTISGLYLVDIL